MPPKPNREIDPAAVVAAMATAVARLRRMAAGVFAGDAALFADLVGHPPDGGGLNRPRRS